MDNDPAHVNTVENNMRNFTQHQVMDATICRAFQNTARLTTNGMISMVDKKIRNNSPVTRESIKHDLSICGPRIPNFDGKTMRSKGDTKLLSEETIATILPHILTHHFVVTFGMDVVKLNGIPLLSTISRILKLGTCTELLNTKLPTI